MCSVGRHLVGRSQRRLSLPGCSLESHSKQVLWEIGKVASVTRVFRLKIRIHSRLTSGLDHRNPARNSRNTVHHPGPRPPTSPGLPPLTNLPPSAISRPEIDSKVMRGPINIGNPLLLPVMSSESPDLRLTSNTNTATDPALSTYLAKNQRALSRPSTSPPSTSGARNFSSNAVARASSPRIVLGPGVLDRLPTELGRLDLSAPLIVSSPSRSDLTSRIHALIPDCDTRVLDPSIIEQFPARNMDDGAIGAISGRDCVISVGGGSAVALARIIGWGKAIPHICIPTTYSGSEFMMRPPTSKTKARDRRRRGRRPSNDSKATSSQPVLIIYDEDLTVSTTRTIFTPSPFNTNGNAHSGEARHRTKDHTPWGYLNLPGI